MSKKDPSEYYSDSRFWQKLKGQGRKAGSELVYLALKLYYAARDPKTPKWARLRIYAALGYFVFPFDALPDFVPLAGYSDDLSLLALAVGTVAFYINDEIKARAAEKRNLWFGENSPEITPENIREPKVKKAAKIKTAK